MTQYKDAQNRIRRQAARFRIYVYDEENKNGRELKIGDVISAASKKSGQMFTGTLTDIQWTVYIANKKSSWYEFEQHAGEHGYSPSHPLRNADITNPSQRQNLIIDPGPRAVSWANPKLRTASFAKGTAQGNPESYPPDDLTPHPITTLGQLMSTTGADGHNRLLVLGGLGNSGSAKQGLGEPSIQNLCQQRRLVRRYLRRTGAGDAGDARRYHRRRARLSRHAPQSIPVDPAWVITGYPRYAPQIVDIVTMDDLVYDVAVRNFKYAPLIYSNGQYNRDYYPYFWRDIWPILQRPFSYGFVADIDPMDGGDPHQSGPKSGGNFDPTILSIPPHAAKIRRTVRIALSAAI